MKLCKIGDKKRVFDESAVLKDNAMLKRRPELFYEWDFEKNDELGLDVYKMTFGSNKLAWWKCPDCKSSYDAKIEPRASKNADCPYCAGKRVNHTNSLAALHPELASEWHTTLNGELTPHDVTAKKGLQVWWLGECGHEWESAINSRSGRKSGCPYCANQRVLIGFNDMWTTNPELAKLLADPEEGYKYTQFSGERADWICSRCKSIVENKQISKINTYKLSCSRCSDDISFGEKFVYHLLRESDIVFQFDLSQKWSQRKRYDFYLPDYNWIIEVHGIQHYENKFEQLGGRSIGQEQENDKLKEKLAKENGIDNYIVIDARESTIEWIRDSIENSDMTEIAKEIDFVRIGQLANNSLVKDACDMWEKGVRNTFVIGKLLKLSTPTVRKYLERGKEIGWCDYSTERRRAVVQLKKNSDFIQIHSSQANVARKLNLSIQNCLARKAKTAGGFKWMYKEDYDAMVESQSQQIS